MRGVIRQFQFEVVVVVVAVAVVVVVSSSISSGGVSSANGKAVDMFNLWTRK
jgi:hypothetical protein